MSAFWSFYFLGLAISLVYFVVTKRDLENYLFQWTLKEGITLPWWRFKLYLAVTILLCSIFWPLTFLYELLF